MTQEQKEAITRAEELLGIYRSIGGAGFFGVAMIPYVINRAKKAFENGTDEEKKEALEELKELE